MKPLKKFNLTLDRRICKVKFVDDNDGILRDHHFAVMDLYIVRCIRSPENTRNVEDSRLCNGRPRQGRKRGLYGTFRVVRARGHRAGKKFNIYVHTLTTYKAVFSFASETCNRRNYFAG